MDEPSTETKREILKLVFPDLQYGGDPGIERYFELRRERRLAQALAVYNGALRVRYPDDASRVQLLRLYRENDPRYARYQESLVLGLASRLCARIRQNLDLITAPLERADLSDALRALKAVESVLARLPGETGAALALLERYDRFALVLGHREALARRALDLVREYDAVSRADSPSEYDFIARSAAIEARRRSAAGASDDGAARGVGAVEEGFDFVSRSAGLEERRKSAEKARRSYFDPRRIRFSKADRARVEISPALSRREDKVLALCAKYWPLALDPAFERIVFLYSRKFGGRHFEVFRAIKLGRARGATDDEILSAVAAILTTSYSYSVSGDVYMQIMWRRLRARMEARTAAERLAAPGPSATTRAGPPPAPESRVRAKRAQAAAAPEPAPKAVSFRDARPQPRPEGLGLRAASRVAAPPERRVQAPQVIPAAPAPEPAAPVPAAPERQPPRADARSRAGVGPEDRVPRGAGREGALLTPAPKARTGKLLNRAPAGPEPLREIRAKHGSISDSIRKLSGKPYDVYKEIFIEKVRDHIHRALLASRTRSHGIFDTTANDAEDHIYGFITAHYDDPFMDWERSAEREAVEALGFSMPSLAPIIEACFKRL
jgi:hypothetical protein